MIFIERDILIQDLSRRKKIDDCLRDNENIEKLNELGVELIYPKTDFDEKLECTGYVLYENYFDKKILKEMDGDMCNYIGENLVRYLIDKKDKYLKNNLEKGSIVLYYKGEELSHTNFSHIGVVIDSEENIISKFTNFGVYLHKIEDIPTNFGNNYLIFGYNGKILKESMNEMFDNIKNKN